MQRHIVIICLLVGCLDLSTGTVADPLLVASGPTASEVLAVAPALYGIDRRPLDCSILPDTPAGILTCALLVACALPPDAVAILRDIEFSGEAGIAPGWRTGEIAQDARQEVSACLLAHLSADGLVAVASLRGRRLVTTPDELAGWTVEEGAFFGDLMAEEPLALACQGVGDPASSVLQERLCAQPDPDRPGLTKCGLTFAGACSLACGHRHGPYHQCNVGRREFTRIVTAFVAP